MQPQAQQIPHTRRPRRPSGRAVALGIMAMLAIALPIAAVAMGSSTATTVASASSSKLGERVVINAQGRTLYALSPETTRHLLCTSGECLKFWPPLTVPSRRTKLSAGSGVQGRLGILRRRDGLLQVTLRGVPLYRFSHDHAKGEVNGQGVESFGGTWHAVSAATNPSPAAQTPPSTTTTPTTGTTPTDTAPTYTTPTSTTPTTTTPTYTAPGYGY